MACKNCGKTLTWADNMRNLALKDKNNMGYCKDCIYKIVDKGLADLKKRKPELFNN